MSTPSLRTIPLRETLEVEFKSDCDALYDAL